MTGSTARLVAASIGVLLAACGRSPSPGDESDAGQTEVGAGLVEITNGTVVVGALPSLGARVVVLKTADGDNLLHSDPGFWKPPFPEPSLEMTFAPWNGRIVWVGPQSGFWSQQDLAPERSGRAWPPDPFNEAGRFAVVERSPTRLRLRGEVSPVTGLRLEHEYEITGPRRVTMTATAFNGRDDAVSWDLWPNTRVQPEGSPYVPVEPAAPLRVKGPEPAETGPGAYPHEIVDGWLTMPPGHTPTSAQGRLWAKAFVRPTQGLIAFFHGGHLLLIRAKPVPVEALHPEQAFVEVYRGAAPGPHGHILELEMHGAHTTLAPGESMTFEQTFDVLDYAGEDSTEAHLKRLASLR